MKHSLVPKTISSEKSKINYITVRGCDPNDRPTLSLAPANSDQVDNQTILNALVATLVKYGTSGKVEPYLASKWTTSEDSLVWKFSIRPGFKCENGEEITAEKFRSAFSDNFRRNIVKSDKTEFNLLKGWQDFVENKKNHPEGLSVEGNQLVFTFEKAPSGLLNFLRMPYFGFWCKNNFENGGFRVDGKFSSSGPYRLEKVISKSRMLLSMREDQPSFDANSPQLIEVGYGSIAEVSSLREPTIVKVIIEDNPTLIPGFTPIDGPPMIFQGVVLHPNSKFFSNPVNRKVFARRFYEFQNIESHHNFSKGFYLTSKLDNSGTFSWPDQYTKVDTDIIRIAFQYNPANLETKKTWENLFAHVFRDQKYELVFPDQNDPNWVKGILNNSDFAVRTASVYAGAHHVVSVIKMMFCTKLGISFPDPSGRICELVEKYSSANLDVDKDFENKFNEYLVQDSAVFPLFHAKDRWLVSEGVNLSTMPTSIIHPLFEKIRLQ